MNVGELMEDIRYVGSCPLFTVVLSTHFISCYGNSLLVILNKLVSVKLVREIVDSSKNWTCFL